jgi:hypothetical protein
MTKIEKYFDGRYSMKGYGLETPAFETPVFTFADRCREIAMAVREKQSDYKLQKALKYYEDIKSKISENSEDGLLYYSFCLEDDFVDKLTKILEENGFVVEATTIRDCGHFIQSNITVWCK